MFPFILTFVTCMASQPSYCVQREMAIESNQMIGCAISGQQMIAFWLSLHPKQFWKSSEGFRCVPQKKKETAV